VVDTSNVDATAAAGTAVDTTFRIDTDDAPARTEAP